MNISLIESELELLTYLIKEHIKKLDKDIKNFKRSDKELERSKQKFIEVEYLKCT